MQTVMLLSFVFSGARDVRMVGRAQPGQRATVIGPSLRALRALRSIRLRAFVSS
jgi:hypothetical protein